jgi:hypothetical protein
VIFATGLIKSVVAFADKVFELFDSDAGVEPGVIQILDKLGDNFGVGGGEITKVIDCRSLPQVDPAKTISV